MDKKKILKEGLLERYLLGELSTEEQAHIENMLQNDANLMKIYRQLEEDFERLAFENAVTPPKHIKTAIKKTLESENSATPKEVIKKEDKNRKLPTSLLVAASLALLFALSSFWLFNKWEATEQNLQVLQQKTSDLQNRLQSIEETYKETENRYRTISNPNVIPLLLEDKNPSSNSRAVAYLNHRTKEVHVNPQGLPELEPEKTYQMWADVDGEMISMGLLPTDTEMVSLKYIDKAQSLNITIEPSGGSEHATVENLVSNVIL